MLKIKGHIFNIQQRRIFIRNNVKNQFAYKREIIAHSVNKGVGQRVGGGVDDAEVVNVKFFE
jgi:hypothetical protein